MLLASPEWTKKLFKYGSYIFCALQKKVIHMQILILKDAQDS